MAIAQRMQHQANQRLNPNIVHNLGNVIRRNNIYAKAHCMLSEVKQEEKEPTVNMAFLRDRNGDRR